MISLVTGPEGKKRLVRARSNKAATDFVVAGSYTAKAVNAEELVDLLATGLVVEEAIEPEDPVEASADESAQETNTESTTNG